MPKSKRRTHDFYETAPWQVDALVDNVPEIGGHVWCPCVGDGSLVNRLLDYHPNLTFFTNDIDTERAADHYGDATDHQTWLSMLAANDQQPPDWIIDNPPFHCELAILRHAYQIATIGVVFMARVSFAEPTQDRIVKSSGKVKHGRGPWLAAHPYSKRITLERYSFTGDGKSDSTTTDWLVWSKIPLQGPFGISAYGYKPR